ncbi:MAG: SIS domain-containing protein [Firmicutes bacterium]|nr:SIS domain-containing protein [Bacillota bacterium]MCL5064530.1 SIS domain-containing protein [Bacillota bacterium]
MRKAEWSMHGMLQELIGRYPDLAPVASDVESAFDVLVAMYARGGKLLVCGNGGSAADSDHIVGELMKGMCMTRPLKGERLAQLTNIPRANRLQQGLPAISLSAQTGLMTAILNDQGGDLIYAQQVLGYGKTGDVLWGISTSGMSVDVVYALEVAKTLGVITIGMTGKRGGALKAWSDVLIQVPYELTHEVQERHLPIYHTLCRMVEQEFFSS